MFFLLSVRVLASRDFGWREIESVFSRLIIDVTFVFVRRFSVIFGVRVVGFVSSLSLIKWTC